MTGFVPEIDPELRDLIDPLKPEERKMLEESILAEGVRDPIVLWDNVIVDGHNRYEIASNYEIPFKTVSREFDSIHHAKCWMIDNQYARRNLTDYQRGRLALKKKPALAEIAESRRVEKRRSSNLNDEGEPDTKQVIAKEAGVSVGTLHAIEKIERDGIDELKEACADNALSINAGKEASKLEPEQQREVVELVKQGDSGSEAVKKTKAKKKKAEQESKHEEKELPAVSVDGLVHGCAIDGLRSLPDESIDLIVTDPPYNMDKADWDSFGSGEDFAAWCEQWLSECVRVLAPHGSLYVFGINRMLSHLQPYLERHLVYRNWIIWDTIQGAGGGLWTNRHEAILYYSKTRDTYENKDAVKLERHEENIREYKGKTYQFKNPSNVWRFPCVDDKSEDRTAHLTQKPVELIQRIIKASCRHKGVVLDPFMGSGTTAVAAIREERKWIGYEKDETHYAIAARRIVDEV